MMSRCFSLGGVTGSAGTTKEPLIDQPIPSTDRPNGAPASASPGMLPPASAGDAPTGTCSTIHGMAAAINSTAECVAKRGAAYFSEQSPFPLPDCGPAVAHTSPTAVDDEGLHRRDRLPHARYSTVTLAA